MIREYQNQGKKTNTDISIPTLKNPVRGFGLEPLDTSPSVLPEAQVIDKPPGHDISKIPLRRPEQSISQPQDCDEQHFRIVQQLFRRMEAERISRSYVQPGEMSTPEVQQSQTKPLVDIITPVVQRQQASQQQQQLNTDAVQLKCSQCEEKEKLQLHADEETQLTSDDLDEQVQLKANGDNRAKSIQQLAAQGFSGSATTIPHLNQIQLWRDTEDSNQESFFQQENLYAQSDDAFQRPPKRPSSKKPNENNCRQILHDILVLLLGGTLEKVNLSVPKGQNPRYVSKGMIERYYQMLYDKELYKYYRNIPKEGIGSWVGHKELYQKLKDALDKLVKSWENDNCDNLDKIRDATKAEIKKAIELAKKWRNVNAPEKPINAGEDDAQFNFQFDLSSIVEGLGKLLMLLWSLATGGEKQPSY
ncbi:hypothetical protein [Anabaena azotica]|uniref:Uncharacterized protein n=1 Tax=Anabaena azotica FACHB-119 TaxID=947527 RepID=A0ABR8CXM1_9NOST|nr:hypothetical protein [Anabaena azotica]MBD2499562.1 hypothetical protein [Anabaena azotica FACHB-119]